MHASESAASGLRDALVEYYLAARVRQERRHLTANPRELDGFILAVTSELARFWTDVEAPSEHPTPSDLRAFRERIEEKARHAGDERLAEASFLLDFAISLATRAGDVDPTRQRFTMIPGSGSGGVSRARLHLVNTTAGGPV